MAVMRAAPFRSRLRPRPGLTVVEVLAALVIVSIGLLGMAGTSALALRTASFASREHRALARLQLRLAALAAAGCGSASSGAAEDASNGVREQWMVAPELRGAALVSASIEWRDGAGIRTLTARSAIVCR